MAAGRLVCCLAAITAAEANLLRWAWRRAKPTAPTAPTILPCDATCPGPCTSNECQTSGQLGMQCFPTGASVSCLVNRTSKAGCTVELRGGEWATACCDAGAKQCGGGCCKSLYGAPHACGTRLDGVGPCCIPEAAIQAQQNEAGCCRVGVGVNCQFPGRQKPCCLDGMAARGLDPYSPCQPKDCSRFHKCYFGTGYDCADWEEGRPEGTPKERCCLKQGGPYPHDTCRASPTCDDGYDPCMETGVDCSTPHGASCCLERLGHERVCRLGGLCAAYHQEQGEERQSFRIQLRVVLGAILVILLVLVVQVCILLRMASMQNDELPLLRHVVQEIPLLRRGLRDVVHMVNANRDQQGRIADSMGILHDDVTMTQTMVDDATTAAKERAMAAKERQQSLLIPNGLTFPVDIPMKFAVHVALTIGCSEYAAKDERLRRLENGNRSAEAVGRALDNLGYKWIHKDDATKADMEAGLREALQRYVCGHQPVLLFIYYGGHGVEGDQGLCWLGTDAKMEDPATHFSVPDMYKKIMEAGDRPSKARQYFGCGAALGALRVIIVSDCCRRAPGRAAEQPRGGASEHPEGEADEHPSFVKIFGEPTLVTLKRELLPCFLVVLTADPGGWAEDGAGSSVSPWVGAFLERLAQYPYHHVQAFFKEVGQSVAKSTKHRQRCWQRTEDNMDWKVILPKTLPTFAHSSPRVTEGGASSSADAATASSSSSGTPA